MGFLDNPRLMELHEQINQAIQWNSRPDWQKVCTVLNGMSMPDMLDELWRVKGTGWLNSLAQFVPNATGVNVNRLRAAIGATQDQPPGDFDALLRQLPSDQRFAIMSVRAVTQAPDPLTPTLWSKFYWSTRSLPAPGTVPPPGTSGSASSGSAGSGDDDAAHLAADIATALTANAPKGSNPTTYTVTVVFRNLDALKIGKGNTELALLHEPNVSVQVSPDPNSPAAYQAAISIVNLHLKRNWGLLKPDVEISLGAQAGVTTPGPNPTAGLQAQVEVHVTTNISIVATSGLGFGPAIKPGDPPDRGATHFGNRDFDVGFTPFMIGIVGHWDPP
jgi:hypothetical protein